MHLQTECLRSPNSSVTPTTAEERFSERSARSPKRRRPGHSLTLIDTTACCTERLSAAFRCTSLNTPPRSASSLLPPESECSPCPAIVGTQAIGPDAIRRVLACRGELSPLSYGASPRSLADGAVPPALRGLKLPPWWRELFGSEVGRPGIRLHRARRAASMNSRRWLA